MIQELVKIVQDMVKLNKQMAEDIRQLWGCVGCLGILVFALSVSVVVLWVVK